MRCPLKWVGLAMALLGILVVGSVNYAQLDRNKGVEAARFTIDGKETVRLKIYATLAEGKQIKVTIGQNEITFTWTAENAKDGLDTGYLEISGSEVLVQLLDVGAPNRCQIPVREIPTATWKRFCTEAANQPPPWPITETISLKLGDRVEKDIGFKSASEVMVYKINLPAGATLAVQVLDCCIPGDIWRAEIYESYPELKAATQGDGSITNWSSPAKATISSGVAYVVVKYVKGVDIWPAGMSVRFEVSS
jgi:hypothetical protein